MRNIFGRPTVLYPLAMTFIISWWLFALAPAQGVIKSFPKSIPPEASHLQSASLPYLRPIVREELHEALAGNTQGMMELIAEWDTDAFLLQSHGIEGVVRLTPEQYLRAQQLGRRLMAQERGEPIPRPIYEWVADDLGIFLPLQRPPNRFLPQTELAAAVLLSLTEPERIVAIPSRLRQQKLFPAQRLQRVPLNSDRYNSEKLFAAHPDVAFVAHYTQPCVIETFKNQGIAQFMVTRIGSLEEVKQTIFKIGHVIGCSEKAELLTLFMDCGFAALDNRLLLNKPNEKKILYLNYYTQFSFPSDHHLIGQLLRRLNVNRFLPTDADCWLVACEGEQIANLAPDVVIISAAKDSGLVELVLSYPALKQTPAIRNGRVFAVDDAVQESPTQFLLLAYYDLVEILRSL